MREHLSYDDHLREKLADEEYARGYLQVALEEAETDGNYAGFLMALRRVVEVRGRTLTSHALLPSTGPASTRLWQRMETPGLKPWALCCTAWA